MTQFSEKQEHSANNVIPLFETSLMLEMNLVDVVHKMPLKTLQQESHHKRGDYFNFWDFHGWGMILSTGCGWGQKLRQTNTMELLYTCQLGSKCDIFKCDHTDQTDDEALFDHSIRWAYLSSDNNRFKVDVSCSGNHV